MIAEFEMAFAFRSAWLRPVLHRGGGRPCPPSPTPTSPLAMDNIDDVCHAVECAP